MGAGGASDLATLAKTAAADLVSVFKLEIAAFLPELATQVTAAVTAAVKPRRGRPPGSKNRPKLEAAAPARKGGRKGGRKTKRKAR